MYSSRVEMVQTSALRERIDASRKASAAAFADFRQRNAGTEQFIPDGLDAGSISLADGEGNIASPNLPYGNSGKRQI